MANENCSHSWHHLLKGKFLEGKRNRRLDHLIHVLVNNVVPYFKAKHHRQRWGFEGPDLELKHRREIEVRAETISANDIEEVNEQGQYSVCSQSIPGHKYTVDINEYTCDCFSYPLISYCKHLAAVQCHHGEDVEVHSLTALFAHIPSTVDPLPSLNQKPHRPSPAPTQYDTEQLTISSITEKLQRLAVRHQLSRPATLCDGMRQLDKILDHLLANNAPPRVLPVQKKIAPNQHSDFASTAKVMGSQVKSKRKSAHLEPYGGGERSAKKAATDARGQPAKGRQSGEQASR